MSKRAFKSFLTKLFLLSLLAVGAVLYQLLSTGSAALGVPTTPAGELLETLVVAEPSYAVEYDRDAWPHWNDTDGDGCNTRFEVLIEESLTPVNVEEGCWISGGTWLSPFDGRSHTAPTTLDVDHLVPLYEAHISGGWEWDRETRERFANDLSYDGSLVAVTSEVNQQKGASTPDEWRPSEEGYWCAYAEDWVRVKTTWGLTVTQSERSALVEMLNTCQAPTA